MLVLQIFNIEIQKGGLNNSAFLQNWFSSPQEIRLPRENFRTLTKVYTAKSCKILLKSK